MKKLIVITSPDFLPYEDRLIKATIDAGTDYVHIRKPLALPEEVERLLLSLPVEYHRHIVLHDTHQLAHSYSVGGLHLNRRNPLPPASWEWGISRSCHTLDEILQHKPHCNYLFLSPIHNSISKKGYNTPFTHKQLIEARDMGIIDEQIIALGGISTDNIAQTLQYGFGGVAVMGCIWNKPSIEEVIKTTKQLKNSLICYNS